MNENAVKEPAIWWKTDSSYRVEKVKVDKTTSRCVVVALGAGRVHRELKHSLYANYWPTPQQALDHLRMRAQRRLVSIEKEATELRRILAESAPPATSQ